MRASTTRVRAAITGRQRSTQACTSIWNLRGRTYTLATAATATLFAPCRAIDQCPGNHEDTDHGVRGTSCVHETEVKTASVSFRLDGGRIEMVLLTLTDISSKAYVLRNVYLTL